MKKLFITMAFVAAAMFANAQFYVGGHIGLNYQKNTETEKIVNVAQTYDGLKQFDFEILPSIGYMFNDNMGVGLEFGVGITTTTYPKADDPYGITTGNQTLKVNQTAFNVIPYFRYVFADVNNFKFYADAKISYKSASPKLTVKDPDANTTTEITGYKESSFGIGIVPGMAYMLTDNISMNAQLNILSLYFVSERSTTTDTDYEDTVKTTEFGFGVNGTTPIKIGFFYTF